MKRSLLSVAVITIAIRSSLAVETVTTLADDGPGSLREAISAASVGENIVFAAGLGGGTIVLESPLLIPKSVVIDASALPAGVTISGNQTVGVMTLTAGTITLKRLVLRDGAGTAGAAILCSGSINLTLEECELRDNVSTRSGSGDSGALYLVGNCVAERCSFIGNTATSSGGSANGGALVVAPGATFTGTNCTFGQNGSDGVGGAIRSWGTLVLNHCTVSKNEAAAAANSGGGIRWNGSFEANHSILAGNVNDDNVSPLGGVSGGDNFFSGDPQLSDPATFGGPTRTMLPLNGSPVIDVATLSAETPATDQRGVARPAAYFPAYDLPALNYDESVGGDFSSVVGSPVLSLGPGTNVISGTVGPTGGGETSDQFVLDLASGLTITSVTLIFDASGGTSGFVDFGSGQVNTSGGTVTQNFTTPLPPGQYSGLASVNFAIAPKSWQMTVEVAGPPAAANDVGAVEANWGEGITFTVPPGYGDATDITAPRDFATAYPSEDLVDGFTSAAQVINNAGGHLAVYAPRSGGLTVTPLVGRSSLLGFVVRNREDLSASNAFDPSSFVLLGSNDGLRFESIGSYYIPAFTTPGGGWLYYLDGGSLPYRHFRVLFPSVIDEPNSFGTVQVGEIQLIGIPDDVSLRVLDFTVDPVTKVYDLTFCSTPGVPYTIQYDQDLDFASPDFITPISGGSVTEWTHRTQGITLSPGHDFLRVTD